MVVLLSRRALVLAAVAAGAWVAAPLVLPAAVLALLARALLVVAVAASASYFLAPSLPRWRLAHLKRRAVFISGCDSGFGHLAALALDALGAPVFAGCLFPEGEGAATLRRKASGRLRVVPLDVTSDASVADAARAVQDALNEDPKMALWAVVNNAGVIAWGEGEWMALDDVQRLFDVNVFGCVRVAQALLPLLRRTRGRLVNVVSLAGRYPMSLLTPYTMSKYAAAAFSDCLRFELDKFSISVHSIEPWITKTALMTNTRENVKRSWERAPEPLKQTYGQEYADKVQNFICGFVKYTAEPSINFVVDAIVDACVARDPQMRYVPGIVGKLFEHVAFFIYIEQVLTHKIFLRWRKVEHQV